ncbi:hypothetical protein [Nocardia sp. CDC160]|uniref:hypothetical protein n=1 Tax=Nocardia sp. CDC160 TaxID=3112166 RepID=UPI002DB8CD05|nr:hypothetical protein [Nocardia sp. CDC160]MEC3920621.1 hypothetical protein [Nocardia sp. CDC160]
MLGTADEIRRADDERDAGDIDPRGLGLVVLIAALMTAGIGAGLWFTGSGDRPIADTSIVNAVRPRHDPPAQRPPNPAPAAQVPAAPNPPAPAPPLVPAAPHAVEIPVVVNPDIPVPDLPMPDQPAPQDDSAPPSG